MDSGDCTTRIRIRFDAGMPHARWGPLFHVFRLEQPDVRLDWQPAGFPTRDSSLLGDADVGLFLEPPYEAGVEGLTLEASPMVVLVAAGDRLGDHAELQVADILDRTFAGSPNLHPRWAWFWTLQERRGAPPTWSDDDVANAQDGLRVVAAGRGIATVPASVAGGLSHPGVIALALGDGPQVRTRLVWRSDRAERIVEALVDLARAWTCRGQGNGREP